MKLFFIQLTISGPERGNCTAAHGLSSCSHNNQYVWIPSTTSIRVSSDYCLLANTTTISINTTKTLQSPVWLDESHQFVDMVIKLWQKGNNNLHIKRRGQGLRISASTLQEMVRVAFETYINHCLHWKHVKNDLPSPKKQLVLSFPGMLKDWRLGMSGGKDFQVPRLVFLWDWTSVKKWSWWPK